LTKSGTKTRFYARPCRQVDIGPYTYVLKVLIESWDLLTEPGIKLTNSVPDLVTQRYHAQAERFLIESDLCRLNQELKLTCMSDLVAKQCHAQVENVLIVSDLY
jgi:hypothetical protein